MDYSNKTGDYYHNFRPEMQALFPANAKKMLDVGCGEGSMAYQIKQKYNIEAWGVEFMKEEGLKAKEKLDRVIVDTVENSIVELPDNYFDVIYCNDVLEHLANPNAVLVKIKQKLTDNGVIISSIPNVRYHSVFKQYIFKKDWKYEGGGVMDFTHLRFFTSKSIKNMYHDAGYEIVMHKGINKTRSLMPYFYNILLFFTAADMFYVQYATIAQKKRTTEN